MFTLFSGVILMIFYTRRQGSWWANSTVWARHFLLSLFKSMELMVILFFPKILILMAFPYFSGKRRLQILDLTKHWSLHVGPSGNTSLRLRLLVIIIGWSCDIIPGTL